MVAARTRFRLGVCCAAVLLAAADTYVVVLALLPMLADLGLSALHLEKATPIVSGFLLGYVAVLPLLGRLSDVYGRRPVFLACLAVFAFGSMITATAGTLSAVVVGRCLQGLGGGGLVPVTLALVGDHWPVGRRGVPLGVVGAVQEFGSVVGPLYGAAVIARWNWRVVFWINVPFALLAGILMLAVRDPGARGEAADTRPGWFDVPGLLLFGAALATTVLVLLSPDALAASDSWGWLYGPVFGDQVTWMTPLVLVAMGLALAALLWELAQPYGVRPLMPLRRTGALLRAADWLGALLIAAVLGCVVITFSAADPARQVIADSGPVLLAAAALLLLLFVVWELRTRNPLIDLSALRDRAAYGSLLTNFAVGAALMAALVDVPVFARDTFTDTQSVAAVVLVFLLVGVPVGAFAGGLVCERLTYRVTTALGMALSAGCFVLMSGWNRDALSGTHYDDVSRFASHLLHGGLGAADLELFVCGLGFGLAIAPINAALLAAVRASLHGVASALVVVARMVGMLVGLSLLTSFGLRRFNVLNEQIASPAQLCPHSPLNCPAYEDAVNNALISELHVVFLGAAIAAAAALLLGLALLRRRAGDAPPVVEAMLAA